jgi:transcriptional regulator with XRE-family HTH domain
MEKKIHQGKNITRFRQMLGMKQEALASILGDDWNQMKISRLEAKEEIEPKLLGEVAKALKVPVEVITTLDDEGAINIISNTVNNNDNATGNSLLNYQPTFNPIDKILELFERLLASEKEKVDLMKEILEKMKK